MERKTAAGYTLIELLVVVMIVLILIAATLPVAKRVMESSRTREASRQLNAHLAMARAYAARNNRPFGLWMEYDTPIGGPAGLHQVTRIYLAEVQQAYSGSTTGSKGMIRMEPTSSGPVARFVPLVSVNYLDANRDGLWDDDSNGDRVPDPADANPQDGRIDEDAAEKALLLTLINDGDRFLVRLDRKGPYFICQRNGDHLNYMAMNTSGAPLSPGMLGTPNEGQFAGYSYQILRAPRRVGKPLEMANGACIDVEYSGTGTQGSEFGGVAQRLVLLFSPKGAVDSLFLDASDPTAPSGTLHFLVGRTDKVNLPLATSTHVSGFNMFDPERSNLADPNSLWVSVGRLNGSITTSENVPDIDHADHHTDPWVGGRLEYLEECRAVATGRELMGGQ